MSSRTFDAILRTVDRGAFPRTRKRGWRFLYNMLSRFWRDTDWRFMNYGYLPTGPAFPLAAEDEPERPFIGLYQQAVAGLVTEGVRILEVGSGRGGGARYLARYHSPAEVVGVDYSPATVRIARKLNADTPGLRFETGDAEHLPFADGSFDIVVNIESSHCYGDPEAFAKEVVRVLVPGGWFTFADMRSKAMLPVLDEQLAVPSLTLMQADRLSPGVVQALDAAERRKRDRMDRLRFLRPFMAEFSGAQGSALYKGLSKGQVEYVARRFQKTPS